MLGPGRYLLGVGELALVVGFAWLGAAAIRRRFVSELNGLTAQLAAAVLAIALLLLTAEVVGAFGWFEAVPYLATVVGAGLTLRLVGGGWGHPSVLLGFSPSESVAVRERGRGEKQDAAAPEGRPHPLSRAGVIALLVAAVAVVHFAAGVKTRLSTGMTGFDSTWYHGPFAAGFYQSGDTWGLHFIAPQFLAWFYPANSEVLHAVGMVAFSRDILSPLLNLGWFVGCLVAAWCIGRPYRVAPWSMALAAIALSVPALSDQAGEARNDIVGIFFLLAAVAILLAQRERGSYPPASGTTIALGPTAVVGLSAGLAAGTKLNFLLPAAVLVVGIAVIAPRGQRWRSLAVSGLGALVGGGYWYLRNLAHTGNPLPWVKHLGPITLPAPEQALGGREGHSVFSYLTDGSVWSDWFLPGIHHGLTILWPLLVAAALSGLLLSVAPLFRCAFAPRMGAKAHRNGLGLVLAGVTGIAAGLAWLIAPTSASGPNGMPHGFESGLRYLAPTLVLGLSLLPAAPAIRHLPNPRSYFFPHAGRKYDRVAVGGVLVLAIAVGYLVQRHYLKDRYADPSFSTPGLNAAFAWAQGIDHARIATTSTRQYPLFGRDLSNHVTYIGEEQPHGGFTAPTTCRRWRQLLNAGHYDYVVTSRDRIEPDKPPYPSTARWTEGEGAKVVSRTPPTVVYQLRKQLDPLACR